MLPFSGQIMATYTLSPHKKNRRTKTQQQFLLRHIGHDILTPLATAMMELRSAADLIPEGKNYQEMTREKLRAIDSCIAHTWGITYAIALMSEKSFTPKSFSLNSLGAGLASLLNTQYRGNPPLRTEGLTGLELETIEPVLYMQIFNFLQNGAQSQISCQGKEDVPLSLAAKVKHFSYEDLKHLGPHNHGHYTPDDPFVQVSVRDSGMGIPEEQLPTIFQSRKYADRGVGLALAEDVCNILHGFIEVESEVGKGSTFSLYIPQILKPDSR